MKILVAVFSLVLASMSAFAAALQSNHASLVLSLRKTIDIPSDKSSSVVLCVDLRDGYSQNSLRGGLKASDKWIPFLISNVDQESFNLELIDDPEPRGESKGFPGSTCWQSKKTVDIITGQTEWIPESTVKTEDQDSISISCKDNSCYLRKSGLEFSLEFEHQPRDMSFCWIGPDVVLIVRQTSSSWNLEILRTNNIARALTSRRMLGYAVVTLATDGAGVKTVPGTTVTMTLTCNASPVKDCLTECPGKPYAQYDTSAGTCVDCASDVQWDETMTCQVCSAANNGVTIGYYFDTVSMKCFSCPPKCKTCDASGCLKCWDDTSIGYYSTSGLKAEVSTRTAGGALRGLRRILASGVFCPTPLTACPDPNCLLCLPSDPTVCLKSDQTNNFFLTQSHDILDCTSPGVYKYQFGNLCGKCIPNCVTCSNSYSCTQCDAANGYNYFDESTGVCVATCPSGTFIQTSPFKACKKCHSSCLTCQGGLNNQCLTCFNPTLFIWPYPIHSSPAGSCSATCPTQAYADTATKRCTPCVAACNRCMGSATNCMSCASGNYRYADQHCGPCTEPGVMIYTGMCTACDPLCATCSGMPSRCTSCSQPGHYLTVSTGTCSTCIITGFYQYVNGGPKECRPCDVNCRTCDNGSSTDCLSCFAGKGLSSLTVPRSCVNCVGPGMYIDGSGLCITCLSDQYSTGTACANCPAGCTACTSASVCTSCDEGQYLIGTLCGTCGTGQFYDVNAQRCVNCEPGCDACTGSGPGMCTTCSTNFGKNGGMCSPCNPSGYYWVDGNSPCAQCSTYCATCNGGTPYDCTSCVYGQIYNAVTSDCNTACAQTWSSVGGGTCTSCSANCVVCPGNVCSQCQAGFMLVGSVCNPCPPHSFSTGGPTCSPCSTDCDTCTSSTMCTSCLNGKGKYYDMGTSSVICVACTGLKYFVAPNQYCGTCHSSCASCNGGTSSSCTSCNDPFKLVAGSCSSSCQPGEYWSSTGGGSCPTCPTHCTTCTGPTTCTGCQAGYGLQGGLCQPCGTHQYFEANLCHDCDPSCDTCTGGGPNQCSTCPTGKGYDSIAHTCTSCSNGYYWVDGNSPCAQCSTYCATCSGGGSNACTSCVNQYGLTGTTCNQCTGSTYFVNGNVACGVCTSPCNTCVQSATQCTSCVTNFGLTGSSCLQCQANQFWTSNPGTCTNCPQNCATCSSNALCLTCIAGTNLHSDNLCRACDTNNGFFVDPADNRCKQCLTSDCKRCSDASTCLECFLPNYLKPAGTCSACTSPNNYYAPISKSCCSVQNCANHNGVTCLQCAAGYMWSGTACIQCSSSCVSCSDPTHCTTCELTYLLRYQAGGNVDCDPCTADGWFKDNNKCYPCNSNCQACSGTATYCTKCQSPNMLVTDLHSCAASCPTTHFQVAVPQSDPVIYECQPCDSTRCSTCTGSAANCQTCKDPLQSPQSGVCCTVNCKDCQQGQCLSCRDGFFLDGSVCSACDSSCKTCDKSATHCTTCPVGKYLYADYTCGQCETAGLFVDGTSCSTCTRTCLTCKEKKENCTSCTKNFTLTNGTCIVAEIPPGKISLVSATFQPSTISASLAFSETVSAIDASTVRAALYTASKESLALAMTASSPGDYLAQLGTPEKAISVSKVIATADTLRFDLVISGQVKNLVLVLAFGKLNAIESDSGSKATYSPHFAIVENVNVVSTEFDKSVAQIKSPATTAMSTATSTLMVASAPQAFILMKIFQNLDFYVFLDILLPPNFIAFLDMITTNFMDIMPNFYEKLVEDDAASQKSKFSEFGTQVNIFSNLGPLFSTLSMFLGLKFVLKAIALGIRKARDGKRSFMDSINEALGLEFFYGMVESHHLDIVLAILVFQAEQSRLDYSGPAKIMTNAFVAVLMLAVLSVYVGMYWYVRRAISKFKKSKETALDSPDKKEHQENSENTSPLEFLVSDKEMEKGNFFQRNFNLLQLSKDILFAGLLYIAYSSPIGILSVLTTAQIAFIVLVFKYRPFTEKRQNLQLKITQVIYGLLDVEMFVLSLLPEEGTENVRYYGIGFTLIGLVLSLFVVSIGFAGYESYLAIKKGISYLRGKGKESQVAPASDKMKRQVSLNDSNLDFIENKSVSSKKTNTSKNMLSDSLDASPSSLSPSNPTQNEKSVNQREKIPLRRKRPEIPKVLEFLPKGKKFYPK
jgi:hypothetical protein